MYQFLKIHQINIKIKTMHSKKAHKNRLTLMPIFLSYEYLGETGWIRYHPYIILYLNGFFKSDMTSIDEIRQAISKGNIQPSNDSPLSGGQIKGPSGLMEAYSIFHGWDVFRANLCDKLWGNFNLELIGFIKSQGYDNEQLKTVLKSAQLEDFHWNWLVKTCLYESDEYNWFFLDVDNKPQAACLIYHPKASAVDSGDIFYIEYVAVAPWNRTNPMSTKLYSGVGAAIIKQVIDFSTKTLGLRHGFSLHSLPKAEGFYNYIGMDRYIAYDKGDLSYYEMSEAVTKSYMEAS